MEDKRTVKYIHEETIHNVDSASIILPLVFEIIKPDSILDVGCGIGTWLLVSKELGVKHVLGLDGGYIDKSLLKKYIDLDDFQEVDLSLPFNLNRKFDLALCLEVVEHLPESSAEWFVKSLVQHSELILFSAAIPGQEGQNHVNEQWPNYWMDLFFKNNFVFIDPIRSLIWENEFVDVWYKQNIFLVVHIDHHLAKSSMSSLNFGVHPELFSTISNSKMLLNQKYQNLKSEMIELKSGSKSFTFYIKLLVKKIIKWTGFL